MLKMKANINISDINNKNNYNNNSPISHTFKRFSQRLESSIKNLLGFPDKIL